MLKKFQVAFPMKSKSSIYGLLIVLLTGYSNVLPQSKYEPSNGCYIGAFVANDYNVNGDIGKFEVAIGKKHSMYLNYANYGDPFPSRWVKAYAATGAIVQIGFEPNSGLDSVKDSEYLRNWAIAARKSGAMILLRWASEMNGPWVAWYGNPQLYIEKFRLVHDIMARYAPNVAMVWAPNVILNDELSTPNYINSYYPGDEYVDWVGIDFYATYVHSDGTPDQADPRQKLQVIYNVYSQKKPIIICEWGATLYTKRTIPPMSTVDFAIRQIDSLYANLQSEFPDVKAVCYFDYNATGVSSNLNDYCLTDSVRVLNAYANAISSKYFLTTPYRNIPYVNMFQVAPDTFSSGRIDVSGTVLADSPIDSVVFKIDDNTILTTMSQPYQAYVDVNYLEDGRHFISMTAYAHSGFMNFDGDSITIYAGRFYPEEVAEVSDTLHFKKTGQWQLSSSQPDRYADYYYYSFSGDGRNRATWAVPIFNDGNYKVFAWWSAYSNRATNAPYIICHSGQFDTIRVNQQTNGGKWNLLGSFFFRGGDTASVSLTNDANGIVIADAILIAFDMPTSVRSQGSVNSVSFNLFQNYPNPFNPSTVIRFHLIKSCNVSLRIYDVLGREVAVLVSGRLSAGDHEIVFDGSNMPSGVYFYKLDAEDVSISRKMTLLK